MQETTDGIEDAPPSIHAIRYIVTSAGGCWQIRRGSDIEEVNSLRNFQNQIGLEKFAGRAISQPAAWIEVSSEE